MDREAQLKVQAFLDGELPDKEAGEVSAWLARDREAEALLVELRQTHELLAGFEEGGRLPESRDFFWSKIKREIERSERPEPARTSVPFMARLRRFLLPSTAFALVAIAGLVASKQTGFLRSPHSAEIETALEDSGAFTYRDFARGTTLVWLSYPADHDVAKEDEAPTLD
jgi:anti-sigma factor RsiW